MWFYRLLGPILSAFALISLTQKVLHVGLAPVMQDTLDYYRTAVHPIMDWLLGWVRWLLPGLQIPEWIKDLYALSFVGGFSFQRGLVRADPDPKERQDPVTVLLGGALFGVTGFGLFAYLIPLFLLSRKDDEDPEDPQDRLEDYYITASLAVAILGAIAFFAINARQ